jgi:GH3 auxin-responsive promoter
MRGWSAIAREGRVALERQMAAWRSPRAAQQACLHRLLTLSAGSAFGVEHGLRAGMTLADWQGAVPVRDASAFDPWTERIAGGERNVLVTEPVLAFELTGGSSGGRRAVPYTPSLLADFQELLLAWFGDLLASHPGIVRGRAYFAVSPSVQRPVTHLGEVPVGLPSDLAYFGPEMATQLAPLLIWHPALEVTDEPEWARRTALHLVAAEDLSLISVWSPTFLSRLLDQVEKDEALPRLLQDGAYGLPSRPERARALDLARRTGAVTDLWPRLALVSAWADAASARPALTLRERLGAVPFQAKGLLATEGFFTLPLSGLPFALPALTGSLLEFEDAAGGVHLTDDLEPGAVYNLIVTTSGGLQRYRMGDRVMAMGVPDRSTGWPSVQMLRFEGRSAGSDLVGEKLDEAFVLTCLDGFGPSAFLASDAVGYDLWLDPDELVSVPPDFLTLLDARLRHNPQYDHARRIGQLRPPCLRLCADLGARYRIYRLSLGHRLSDIKPPALLPYGPLHPQHWAL